MASIEPYFFRVVWIRWAENSAIKLLYSLRASGFSWTVGLFVFSLHSMTKWSSSFMYMLKRKGDRMLPWGTPFFSNITSRSMMPAFIIFSISFQTLGEFRRFEKALARRWRFTLSNALRTS